MATRQECINNLVKNGLTEDEANKAFDDVIAQKEKLADDPMMEQKLSSSVQQRAQQKRIAEAVKRRKAAINAVKFDEIMSKMEKRRREKSVQRKRLNG